MSGLLWRACWLLATVCVAMGWTQRGVVAEGLPPAILEKVKSSTAFLRVESRQGSGRGSGFLVSPELLVTNAHVVGVTKDQSQAASRITAVLFSGSPREVSVPANVLAVDVVSDLAFLEIPKQANTTFLELVPSKEIGETLPVYIVGFPLGEALDSKQRNPAVTIGSGIVSSLRRNNFDQVEEIQIDGNMIPGNSGGPIVDGRGRVVAVSVATILGTGIGFSIPADSVEANLNGRIRSASFEHDVTSDRTYRVRVKIQTIDPNKRVKSVGLYYWKSALDSIRPLDPISKIGIHGAPGDGQRKEIRLQYESSSDTWKGEISKVEVNDDEDFWIQPAIQLPEGVEFVSPNNYAPILRRDAGRTGAGDGTSGHRSTRNSEQRSAPIGDQPLTDEELSDIRESLRVRFEKTSVRTEPKVVQPDPSSAIEGRLQRDEHGHQFSVVESQAEKIKLGDSKLLQMVADPRGVALFAIFEGKSAVVVFDTEDMSVIDEIQVARFPVSLACGDQLMAVACSDSKLISLIDLESRKVLKSVRIKDDASLVPRSVVGIAPDGSFMTLWKRSDPPSSDSFLYLVDLEKAPLFTMKGLFQWCALPNKAEYLWTQSNFGGSPSGVSTIFTFARSGTNGYMRSPNGDFGPKGPSFHRDCGYGFASRDGKSFLLPLESQEFLNHIGPDSSKTLVIQPDLKNILIEWPGNAICEYPSAKCIVTYRLALTPDHAGPMPEILFVSPSNGRIIRKVQVTGAQTSHLTFQQKTGLPNVVFIPGREIVLYQDIFSISANDSVVTMIRCGPLLADDLVAADPAIRIDNDPPTRAVVGEKMTYTPSFEVPEGAGNIEFRLQKNLPGLEIDPKTGTISFLPTSANVGLFDIAIVAVVDGIEIPVLKWILEIDEP